MFIVYYVEMFVNICQVFSITPISIWDIQRFFNNLGKDS
jgi:hypothetical protein